MMDLDFIQEMDCRAYVLSQSTRFIDIGIPKVITTPTHIPKEFDESGDYWFTRAGRRCTLTQPRGRYYQNK